jgi:hypothetical protein
MVWIHIAGADIWRHSFLTLALDEDGWLLHAATALPPTKTTARLDVLENRKMPSSAGNPIPIVVPVT